MEISNRRKVVLFLSLLAVLSSTLLLCIVAVKHHKYDERLIIAEEKRKTAEMFIGNEDRFYEFAEYLSSFNKDFAFSVHPMKDGKLSIDSDFSDSGFRRRCTEFFERIGLEDGIVVDVYLAEDSAGTIEFSSMKNIAFYPWQKNYCCFYLTYSSSVRGEGISFHLFGDDWLDDHWIVYAIGMV